MVAKKDLIIDVDTGIDDALALILSYKKAQYKILGITTSGGNVGILKTTRNTLGIVSLLGADMSVYRGAEKPLKRDSYILAEDYHGENGLCNIELVTDKAEETMSAVEFIVSRLKSAKFPVTIIGLAPPTNIARAIEKDQSIVKNIETLYLMGGAVKVPGNQTPKAEFNFYQDPEAVNIIFKHVPNVHIIPLDVTNKCLIEKSDVEDFTPKNKVETFFKNAVLNWYKFFGTPKKRKFELYDPLAVSPILGNFLRFEQVSVRVNTTDNPGAIEEGPSSIFYADKVDADSFKNFFLESLRF